MQGHWDHIDRVLRAGSLDELEQLTAAYATSLGFKNHGYAIKLVNTTGSTDAGHGDHSSYRFFHNFKNAWGDHYHTLNRPEAERTDARILLARAGLPGSAWNVRGQFDEYARVRPDIARLGEKQTRLAGEFGMSGGLTIPGWSPGVGWAFLTLATDATYNLKELGSYIESAAYFVNCLQATTDRLLRRAGWFPKISEREREVLQWSAMGKTAWEVSAILRISESTVNFHLRQAAKKLHVNNKVALCAQATALGLISL